MPIQKSKEPGPPCWPDKLLKRLCASHLREEVMGDLHERYYLRVQKLGVVKARKQYWREVLAYLRPAVFKRKKSYHSKSNFTNMLGYNFKIAFRNLVSKKFYSFINILGLSIGMTCCLLIFQFVAFEYSFDTFNKNEPDLYRVLRTITKSGAQPEVSSTNGWAVGPSLAQEVPEVVRFLRLHPDGSSTVVSNPEQPDKAFKEGQVYYADSTLFQMFSYRLISGNPADALAKPGTVMLSESVARKYFGNEDPMGRTLTVKGWIGGTYRVDGIFKDVPANSHLQFDILLPMIDLLQKGKFKDSDPEGWSWHNFITYVQLHKDADLAAVERKFTDILTRNNEEGWRPTNTTGYMKMQPLLDIHLNDDIVAPGAVMGSYRAVYFFAVIGLVTLLIALINYVNLTTARALDRAREVGVRKVNGARRGQLITQFLTESVLTLFAAFLLAVILAEAFGPVLNNLAGISIANILWKSPYFWVVFFAIFSITTLLSGLYPAFILSSFQPMVVLKGKSGRLTAGTGSRRGLVVLQFTASITLLVGTSIVYNQLNYVQNMELGMDLEEIMIVHTPRVLPEGTGWAKAIETYTQKLHQLVPVRQTASSFSVPGQEFAWSTSSIRKLAADWSASIDGLCTWIDSDFASLYGLQLIAGKGFKHILNPSTEGGIKPIIINQTAVHALGFDAPEDAINEKIDIAGNECQVVGVFKDFHWSSAHRARKSTFFFLGRDNPQISIKVGTENLPETIASIEGIYKQLFPGNPFQYAFADETFDMQYRNDRRFARLFGIFAALAIFIACMGLFGLATFTARQRNREIGIRKAMGATAANIVALLSKDFLKLVIIGFLVAIPIAWYTMNRWLEDFAYKIEIHPGLFLLAGLVAILIALATVSWQSVKAALMDPTDSLRDE